MAVIFSPPQQQVAPNTSQQILAAQQQLLTQQKQQQQPLTYSQAQQVLQPSSGSFLQQVQQRQLQETQRQQSLAGTTAELQTRAPEFKQAQATVEEEARQQAIAKEKADAYNMAVDWVNRKIEGKYIVRVTDNPKEASLYGQANQIYKQLTSNRDIQNAMYAGGEARIAAKAGGFKNVEEYLSTAQYLSKATPAQQLPSKIQESKVIDVGGLLKSSAQPGTFKDFQDYATSTSDNITSKIKPEVKLDIYGLTEGSTRTFNTPWANEGTRNILGNIYQGDKRIAENLKTNIGSAFDFLGSKINNKPSFAQTQFLPLVVKEAMTPLKTQTGGAPDWFAKSGESYANLLSTVKGAESQSAVGIPINNKPSFAQTQFLPLVVKEAMTPLKTQTGTDIVTMTVGKEIQRQKDIYSDLGLTGTIFQLTPLGHLQGQDFWSRSGRSAVKEGYNTLVKDVTPLAEELTILKKPGVNYWNPLNNNITNLSPEESEIQKREFQKGVTESLLLREITPVTKFKEQAATRYQESFNKEYADIISKVNDRYSKILSDNIDKKYGNDIAQGKLTQDQAYVQYQNTDEYKKLVEQSNKDIYSDIKNTGAPITLEAVKRFVYSSAQMLPSTYLGAGLTVGAFEAFAAAPSIVQKGVELGFGVKGIGEYRAAELPEQKLSAGANIIPALWGIKEDVFSPVVSGPILTKPTGLTNEQFRLGVREETISPGFSYQKSTAFKNRLDWLGEKLGSETIKGLGAPDIVTGMPGPKLSAEQIADLTKTLKDQGLSDKAIDKIVNPPTPFMRKGFVEESTTKQFNAKLKAEIKNKVGYLPKTVNIHTQEGLTFENIREPSITNVKISKQGVVNIDLAESAKTGIQVYKPGIFSQVGETKVESATRGINRYLQTPIDIKSTDWLKLTPEEVKGLRLKTARPLGQEPTVTLERFGERMINGKKVQVRLYEQYPVSKYIYKVSKEGEVLLPKPRSKVLGMSKGEGTVFATELRTIKGKGTKILFSGAGTPEIEGLTSLKLSESGKWVPVTERNVKIPFYELNKGKPIYLGNERAVKSVFNEMMNVKPGKTTSIFESKEMITTTGGKPAVIDITESNIRGLDVKKLEASITSNAQQVSSGIRTPTSTKFRPEGTVGDFSALSRKIEDVNLKSGNTLPIEPVKSQGKARTISGESKFTPVAALEQAYKEETLGTGGGAKTIANIEEELYSNAKGLSLDLSKEMPVQMLPTPRTEYLSGVKITAPETTAIFPFSGIGSAGKNLAVTRISGRAELISRTVTPLVTATPSRSISRQPSISVSIQDNALSLVQQTPQRLQQVPIERTLTVQTNEQVQQNVQAQEQVQKQVQKQLNLLQTVQTPTTVTSRIATSPLVPRLTIPIPPVSALAPTKTERPRISSKGIPGYEVLVRRRKKYRVESPFALSKEEAFTFGAGKVLGSAAATFKLVPTKESARTLGLGRSPNLGRFFRPPKKGGELTFVQKRELRITSPGEKREISAVGAATRRANAFRTRLAKPTRSFLPRPSARLAKSTIFKKKLTSNRKRRFKFI